MPRRKADSPRDDQGPSFEEALEGLESIVEAMENEQLPLEELVAYYEKGSKLMGRCESILESARERIELITLENKGGAQPRDAAKSSAAADATEDDDIRLL